MVLSISEVQTEQPMTSALGLSFLCEMLTSPSICLQSALFQMVKDVGETCDIQNNGPEIKVLVWVSQRQQRNLRGWSVSVRAWC